MRDPDFTLSAGPVMASPRVLAALGSPLVYHYDPAFLEAFRRTERKLAQIFLTGNDVLLMQGEAVLGLEAAARGLVQPGTPVLNLVQGVFGKGMGYWLKDFGAELHELEVPYNDAVDPAVGVRPPRRRGGGGRAARGGARGVDRAARALGGGLSRGRPGDGARALAAERGDLRGVRDGDRAAGPADGRSGARALSRALRR